MDFNSKINEVVNDNAPEVKPEVGENKSETNEVNEVTSETKETKHELRDEIMEFAKERADLHARIIGKDEYGRNVSDWCGCNNACTHTAL